jgi:hypothetical protein
MKRTLLIILSVSVVYCIYTWCNCRYSFKTKLYLQCETSNKKLCYSGVLDTFDMAMLTQFDWDSLYVFEEGSVYSSMSKIVGSFVKSVYEGEQKIVFRKGKTRHTYNIKLNDIQFMAIYPYLHIDRKHAHFFVTRYQNRYLLRNIYYCGGMENCAYTGKQDNECQ